MDILNAYDLTGSYRAAAELCGCSHHTVKKAVDDRAAGLAPAVRRSRKIDDFLSHLEGWVVDSKGKIRADRAHEKLVALGYDGDERTTRRAVAEVKVQWRLGNSRVHRPWVTEPGLWLQYDFGDGPTVGGRKVVLLVAWLAWCRYRVVIALRDRTAPSVFAGLDRVFRIIGGAPTYVLTDNEKTVTTGHIAGVPVRNRDAVSFSRYYGVTVLTCQPADPASKGGVENAVKLAKADIVPTQTNLLAAYDSFAQVEAACTEFMDQVNFREHRVTGRKPARHRRSTAHRRARRYPQGCRQHPEMITFEHAQYSVPAPLLGQTVWVRHHLGTGEVVICALDGGGPIEVARHQRTNRGTPAIDDSHFPGHTPKVPGDYRIKARNEAERAFLAIGEGAGLWVKEAAAVGTERMYQKMARAVELAALGTTADVDWALGHAAVHGRFATGDLESILSSKGTDLTRHAADESASLSQGTKSWNRLGPNIISNTGTDQETTR